MVSDETTINKTLAIRIHRCPCCGLKIYRDHNASINILRNAMKDILKLFWNLGNLRLWRLNQYIQSIENRLQVRSMNQEEATELIRW